MMKSAPRYASHLFSALIAAVLSLVCLPAHAADLDGNGLVDSEDAQLLANQLLGDSPPDLFLLQQADVNRDGAVDVADIVSLLLVKGAPPPVTVPILGRLSLPAPLQPETFLVANKFGQTRPDPDGFFELPVLHEGVTVLAAVADDYTTTGENVWVAVVCRPPGSPVPDPETVEVTVDPASTARGLIQLHPQFLTPDPSELEAIGDLIAANPNLAALQTQVESRFPSTLHPFDDPDFLNAYLTAMQAMGELPPVIARNPVSAKSTPAGHDFALQQTLRPADPRVQAHQLDSIRQLEWAVESPGDLQIEAVLANPLDTYVGIWRVDPMAEHAYRSAGANQETFLIDSLDDVFALRNRPAAPPADRYPFFTLLPVEPEFGVAAANSFYSYLDVIGLIVDAIAGPLHLGGGEDFAQLPIDGGEDALYLVRGFNGRLVSGFDTAEWAFGWENYPAETVTALSLNILNGALEAMSILVDLDELTVPCAGGVFTAVVQRINELVNLSDEPVPSTVFGWMLEIGKTATITFADCVIDKIVEAPLVALVNLSKSLASILDVTGKASSAGSLVERLTALSGFPIGIATNFMTPMDSALIVVGDPWGPRIDSVNGVSPAAPGDPLQVVEIGGTLTILGKRFQNASAALPDVIVTASDGRSARVDVGAGQFNAAVDGATPPTQSIQIPLPDGVSERISIAVLTPAGQDGTPPVLEIPPVFQRLTGSFLFRTPGGALTPEAVFQAHGKAFLPAVHRVNVGGSIVDPGGGSTVSRLDFTAPPGLPVGAHEVKVRWRNPADDVAASPTQSIRVLGPPVIDSVFPTTVRPGQGIQLLGRNFGNDRARIIVRFADGTGEDTRTPTGVLDQGTDGTDQVATIFVKVATFVNPDPGQPVQVRVETPAGLSNPIELTIDDSAAPALTRFLTVPDLSPADAIRFANQDPAPAGSITRNFFCNGEFASFVVRYPDSWKPMPASPASGESHIGTTGVSVPSGRPFAEGGVCNEIDIPDAPADPGPITWEGFTADQIFDHISLAAGDGSGDTDLSALAGGPALRGRYVRVNGPAGVNARVVGGGLVIEGVGMDDPLHRQIDVNLQIVEATGTVITFRNCNGATFDVTIYAAAGGADIGVLIENCRGIEGRVRAARGCANTVIVRDSEDCDIDIIGMAGYETGLLIDGGRNNFFARVAAGITLSADFLQEVIDPGQQIGIRLTGGTEGNTLRDLNVVGNQIGIQIDDASRNTIEVDTIGAYLNGSTGNLDTTGPNGGDTANAVGIRITGTASNNLITGDYITNNTTGVLIDGGQDNRLTSLRIGGNASLHNALGNQTGLLIDGSLTPPPVNNTIDDCDFLDNVLAGLSVESLADSNAIVDCRFGGKDVEREGGAMSNAGNGAAGLRIANSLMLSQIQGNVFRAENIAVHIEDSRLIDLADNVVMYPQDEGVRIENSHQITLSGERICGSFYALDTCFAGFEGNVGLRLIASSAVSINEVRVEALGGDGILIEDPPADYFGPSRIEGTYDAGSVVPEPGRAEPFASLLNPPDDRTAGGREIRSSANQGNGVIVRNGARGITLAGLRSTDNTGHGLLLDNPGDDFTLQESTLTDNLQDGVHVANAAAGNLRIGLPRTGNLIGANEGWGVSIQASEHVAVQGNFIVFNGLNSGDVIGGVLIDDSDEIHVGGANLDAGNLVSANRNDGVRIANIPDTLVPPLYRVENNFIGTTFPGDEALGNAGYGVRVLGGAGLPDTQLRIAANLVSANTAGGIGMQQLGLQSGPIVDGNIIGQSAQNPAIGLPNPANGIDLIDVHNAIVFDNRVAMNAGVGLNLSNADNNLLRANTIESQSGPGLRAAADSSANTIDRNTILNNGASGIEIDGASTGNTLTGNAVSANALDGILLTNGGNNELPAPTIGSVGKTSGNRYTFFGSVDPALPDGSVAEIFADDTDEGRHFLARDVVSNGLFAVQNVRGPAGIALASLNFTATVTDLNGDTSPFGPFASLTGGLRDNVPYCLDPPDPRFDRIVASERDGDIVLTAVNNCATTPTAISSGSDAHPSIVGAGDELRMTLSSSRDGNPEIYWGSVDALLRVTDHAAADTEPALSPDGSRIAFVSERDGNREVYVINADGNNLVRITNDAGDDRQPDWSPDGTQLVFSSNRTGEYKLFTANAFDGTNLQQRTFDASADHTHPSWRKLDQWIAYQHTPTGDSPRIGVLDLSGGQTTLIPNAGWSDEQPEWIVGSGGIPYIVISSRPDAGEPYHLYLLEFSGRLLWRITPDDAEDRHPSVAP